MRPRQLALSAFTLVGAAVVQPVLAARVALPGGPPQLVVLVVVAIALAGGSGPAMAAGFVGGLLAALTPPSLTPVGEAAVLLVVIGYLVGRARPAGRIGRRAAAAYAAAATFVALTGMAAFGALLGGSGDGWGSVTAGLPGGIGYSALLGALVIPGVRARWRSANRPVVTW